MKSIILFLVTMTSAFVIDILWLGFIAKNIYAQHLGMLLRKSGEANTPIWWAVIMVYICIAIGIFFFVLPKANSNYFLALAYGALFGLVTYGIYEFTNYALLARWPLNIVFIDLVWGMILCGLTSLIAVFIQNRFL